MADIFYEDATHKTALDGDEAISATSDPGGTPADVYLTPEDLTNYIVNKYYKLSVTVSANDLVVALKTPADADPSAADPIRVKINGTIYSITAALSITIPDGTNWFNSGGAELGTLAQPYFAYIVYDSNSTTVALSISRIPWGRVVSDFSATTTNEKHLYNYANFTATDNVINIGYFEAILSLSGTSHLWTVPTFNAVNLRHEPTFESEWKTWTPTSTTSGSLTYSTVTYPVAKYKIGQHELRYEIGASGTLGGTASTRVSFTTPFICAQIGLTDPPLAGSGWASDTSSMCSCFLQAGTPNIISFFKQALANYNNSGTCTLRSTGFYEI